MSHLRASPLRASLALLAGLSLACGDSDAPSASSSPAPAPAPATTPAPTAPQPGVDPLAGKTTRQICEDNGLAMIKWSYEQLNTDFRSLCCGADGIQDDPVCELDWPFSDVPPCDAYDFMRNHIYARYGYPFKDPRFVQEFGTKDWYQKRDDFNAAWLSPVASKNVETLKKLKADKVACMD